VSSGRMRRVAASAAVDSKRRLWASTLHNALSHWRGRFWRAARPRGATASAN
jgi:hypothetical protein